MSDYPDPSWAEWGMRIASALDLKKNGKQFSGSCPVCGGDDRFHIKEKNGLVKLWCRACEDKGFIPIVDSLRAQNLWPGAQNNVVQLTQKLEFPVHPENAPYHVRKGIEVKAIEDAYVEDDGTTLRFKTYSIEGEENGWQRCFSSGEKRTKPGLKFDAGVLAKLGSLQLANQSHDTVYLCEGYADMYAVHKATGKTSVCCLGTPHLVNLSKLLIAKYPKAQFIVAADNDPEGIAKAEATGLRWAAPAHEGADWNDVFIAQGEGAVAEGLNKFGKANKKPLFVRLDQLKVQQPQWLIEGILEQDSLAIIFGASGTYKSFIAIDMGLSVACGKDYHGHATKQGTVIFIAGEGHVGFSRRTEGWFANYDIDKTAIPLFKSERAITLANDTMAEIFEFLDAVQKSDGKPDLIVLDTLDRSIDGVEDNNDDTKRYLDFCDQVRTRYNCTICVVSHTGHAAPDRAKGSTKLKDRMDSSYLVKTWGQNNVDLISKKMKDAEPPDTMTFLRRPFTIVTDDGEEADTLVLDLVPSSPSEGISQERFHDIIMDNFERQKENGRMKQADLKRLVATDTSMSQKTAERRIKDLIDEKIFKLDGHWISEGDSYVPKPF